MDVFMWTSSINEVFSIARFHHRRPEWLWPIFPWWNFGQAPQKAYPVCNFLFIAMLSSHVCSHVYGTDCIRTFFFFFFFSSSSSSCTNAYHHYISSLHIVIIAYHHYISSLHIIITYHHYISSLHIIITYHHYISITYIYIHTWQLSICRSPRSQVFLWPHVASDIAQLPTALPRLAARYGVAGCQRTWGARKPQFPMDYPLVNIQKTMENHHFELENSLFLWPFSIAMLVITRGYLVNIEKTMDKWKNLTLELENHHFEGVNQRNFQ